MAEAIRPVESWDGFGDEEAFAQGEVLLQEGDVCARGYRILEGEVSVWKATRGGRIELARLGAGAIIGEMSLMDGEPCTASVVTLRTTRVQPFGRDAFQRRCRHDPDFSAELLQLLVTRLRQSDSRLALMERRAGAVPAPILNPVPSDEAYEPPVSSRRAFRLPQALRRNAAPQPLKVTLEGLTEPARRALPSNPYEIDQLPCRIGRSGGARDAGSPSGNDLNLHDFEPYQIDEHHLLIFEERRSEAQHGRIGILDRGSRLGSWLDQRRLGGLMADESPTYLPVGTAELVLGDADSQFRFRVQVAPR